MPLWLFSYLQSTSTRSLQNEAKGSKNKQKESKKESKGIKNGIKKNQKESKMESKLEPGEPKMKQKESKRKESKRGETEKNTFPIRDSLCLDLDLGLCG